MLQSSFHTQLYNAEPMRGVAFQSSSEKGYPKASALDEISTLTVFLFFNLYGTL